MFKNIVSNFYSKKYILIYRGTDPNQHTLDTLEQAIAVLIERGVDLGRDTVNGSQSNDKKSTEKRNGKKIITFVILRSF